MESLLRAGNEQNKFVNKFNHLCAVVENIEVVNEVSSELLMELVDKIEVFECEKLPHSRMKSAKIKVYFNGIGTLI